MSWPKIVETALVIIVAIFAVAGSAAAFAILVQIVRQGGLKLVERSVRVSRWRMVRLWLFVGAVIGLLTGIAIVFLNRMEQTPRAETKDGITSPSIEIKSRPRADEQPTE
jgi:hypothetical protein